MSTRPSVLACVACVVVAACAATPPTAPRAPAEAPAEMAPEPYVPFAERRARHTTRVDDLGPNVVDPLPERPPAWDEVVYSSGTLSLKAWLHAGAPGAARPAVLYLHNDFGLTQLSVDNARAFVEAGFVVLLPMWRGENGNPGRFELLYGEVDDALSAAKLLAAHPHVDRRFIYAFGHSIGGGVAAMLSLHRDAPLRRTASVGGIYRASAFDSWAAAPGAKLIRFDRAQREEVSLRILGPNVRDLVVPHVAYAGRADRHDLADARYVEERARPHRAPYEVVELEGDHVTSVPPAARDFIARIRRDRGE